MHKKGRKAQESVQGGGGSSKNFLVRSSNSQPLIACKVS